MKSANGLVSTKLRDACRQNNALTKALIACLPPDFAPHVMVTKYQNGVITISADSAAWMTTLRFHTNSILSNLSIEAGIEIKSLNIKVIPARVFKPFDELVVVKREVDVSKATAESLKQVGESTVDPTLSAALLRLARHGFTRK